MKLLLNFVQQNEKEGNEHLYVLYNSPLTTEQNIYILIYHPQIVLICDDCERRLNFSASVLFLSQQNKDLCLTCFAKIGYYDKPYNYFVRPNLNISITQNQWSIISDLLLLNGLQKYGYGNWKQIKNYLDYHGHTFASKDIKNHFDKFYLSYNLSPNFINQFTAVVELKPYHHEPFQVKSSKQAINMPLIQHKIQIYDEKRQEFLIDYDEEAEMKICDLEFTSQDTQEEIQLKYQLIQEYDYRLSQRKKRANFTLQHKFLTQQFQRKWLSNTKTKNKIQRQLRCYSKFLSPEQIEELTSNMTLQSMLQATTLSMSSKQSQFQSFQELYNYFKNKKQKLQQKKGKSPIDLSNKIVFQSNTKQLKRKQKFEYIQSMRKIKKLDFIQKEINTKIISWGKQTI